MADIFISYSRKDKEFAARLFDALEAAGRDAWLDSKDIPPSAEWLAEIQRSIEGAHAFLFIISPDSLRSTVCAQELAHAVAQHKRLAPVVWRDPGGEAIPAELSKLNWIFLRAEDSFEVGLASLFSALDTDLEYVRLHTRLLLRAREWQEKGKSGSFTLRGEDLRAAEAWLGEGAAKEPRPAQLQVEYIAASRQAERTRQRRTLGAVLAALVVTVALAILAFWQSQLATSREQARATAQAEAVSNAATAVANEHARATQQAIAEAQRRTALASKLATQSRLLYEQQLDLALLLAVLSGQINPGFEEAGALHDALEQRPDLAQYLGGIPGGVRRTVFTPDGQELVAAGADGSLQRWSLASGQAQASPLQRSGALILDVSFGPGGETWVTSLEGERLSVWRGSDGKKLGPEIAFRRPAGGSNDTVYLPHVATLSPDGARLAVAVGEEITIYDVASGAQTGANDVMLGFPPSALVYSPDGQALASAGNERLVYLWDGTSGKNLATWTTSQTRNITSLAFSPDGRYLASGSEDGTADLFLRETGEQRQPQPQTSITTGQVIPPPALGHPAAVNALAFSPDGEVLVSGADDGNLLVWDTNAMIPRTVPRPAYVGPIAWLAFSPDGASFAAAGSSGAITLWQPAADWRLAREQTDADLDIPLHDEPSQKLERLTSSAASGAAAVKELLRATHLKTRATATGGCAEAAKPSDPCPRGAVRAFAADGQEIPLQPANIPAWVDALSFSPDGNHLAAADCSGRAGFDCAGSDIWVWSLPGGELKQFYLANVQVEQLVFSDDGRYLAAGGQGKELLLSDLHSGRQVRLAASSLPGQLSSLAFSPDSLWLAASAAYYDPGPYINDIQHSQLQVWDAASGEPVARKLLPGRVVDFLTFSADGQVLKLSLSGLGDTGFKVWELGLARWQALACRIANRDLSEAEWARYVEGEPYRKVCP